MEAARLEDATNEELVRWYQRTGDERYFEALLRKNKGLIYQTLRRYLAKFPKADPEDLEREAEYGMWVAARRFDERRGGSFAHVAVIWMRKQIMSTGHRYNGVVYFPSLSAKEIRKLHSKASLATAEEGREVPVEEIMDRENDSRRWLRHYRDVYDPLSLNWSPDPEELPDFEAITGDPAAERALEDVVAAVDLEALMAGLSEAECLCLRLRLQGETISEIARRLGKPAYWVKAVLNQIRVKLRHPSRWGF
ncbi:MAG: sigma-70 family RNA polymerase sigma factor [Clostridiales bacterium]|nr:sigma-70 family RNA polymerase sigma factor [Clostridiales bacterium]